MLQWFLRFEVTNSSSPARELPLLRREPRDQPMPEEFRPEEPQAQLKIGASACERGIQAGGPTFRPRVEQPGRGPSNKSAGRVSRPWGGLVGSLNSCGPDVPVQWWSCGPVVLLSPYNGGAVVPVQWWSCDPSLLSNRECEKKTYFWREPATKEKINMKGNPF